MFAVFFDLSALDCDRIVGQMNRLIDISWLGGHCHRVDVDLGHRLLNAIAKRQRLLKPLLAVLVIPAAIDKAVDFDERLIDHQVVANDVDFLRQQSLRDGVVCITALIKVFKRVPVIEAYGRDHMLDQDRRAILQRLETTIVHDLVKWNCLHRHATELGVVGLDHHVADAIKLCAIEHFNVRNLPAGILKHACELLIEIRVVTGDKRRHPWGLL